MTSLMIDDLRDALGSADGGIEVAADKRLTDFEQFAHLAVLPALTQGAPREVERATTRLYTFARQKITTPQRDVDRLDDLIAADEAARTAWR